jgi:hypothetical protein
MDDEGMRILRGKGKRPRYATNPKTLLEVEPGRVVLICVRVAAHFAGPRGEYTDVMVRPFDYAEQMEIYGCGELYIPKCYLVATYEAEEE